MTQISSRESFADSSPDSEPHGRERFESAVAPLRGELLAHCYRMLGSVFDADDALQDALLRAWRAFDRFEGRSSLRTWLYTVATRCCLDTAAARGRRALPVDLGPASVEIDRNAAPRDDVPWLTPYPDPADVAGGAERVELAFIAALQHLSGNERAALLLTDVLGFSAGEAAAVLQTTPTAVHSALARARRAFSAGDRRHTATDAPSPATIALARQFADALATADIERFIGLLTPDVTWQMPPLVQWYQGADAVSRFAHAVPMTLCPSWRTSVVTANGVPAVAFYLGENDQAPHHAWSLTLLQATSGRVSAITSFLDPALFARFGLASTYPE